MNDKKNVNGSVQRLAEAFHDVITDAVAKEVKPLYGRMDMLEESNEEIKESNKEIKESVKNNQRKHGKYFSTAKKRYSWRHERVG